MKKLFTLLMLCLVLPFTLNAQQKALQSYLSYTTYCIPGGSPYIENAIAFDCSTVVYKQIEPGKFMASVEIQTIFRKGDKVANFSKVALDSPVVNDTANITGAFIDQQRFSLENGEYNMEITIKDLNNVNQIPYRTEQTISVQFPEDHPSVSDLLLVESYKPATTPSDLTKSGNDIVPRIYAFYLANSNSLTFYAEMYNSDKYYPEGGKYLVEYYIQAMESSRKMKGFNFVKHMDVKNVNGMLNTIDIRNLPTGNYYLVLEMRDRENRLMASNSVFFQRYNPGCELELDDIPTAVIANTFAERITNIDTIREYIRCLNPRCSEAERDYSNNLVKTNDLTTMQQFLYTFWSTRAPLDPEKAWIEYYAQVKLVNASYSTRTKKGYMTDRGYVYLKYGTPDKICEEPYEPGAFPYEIWHYYAVANQRNKRFVFMSRDMVTNDYQLIHSDVPGEVYNNRWQLLIYSRFYGPDYTGDIIDQTEAPDTWGSRAGDLYRNPR